jgi:poly-gamma-glutamate synthesis protein (capsule biosynthesis protein)
VNAVVVDDQEEPNVANGRSRLTLMGVGDIMAPQPPDTLFDFVKADLQAADITFANCEWPYTEEPGETHPVEAHLNDLVEEGDLFVPGNPASIRMIAGAGVNVMSCANNHFPHSGYRAFFRTLELLREAGIAPVGAGANIEEALRPVVLERNGTKVAFLACASALLPGTQAGRRTPGIVPLRRHSYFENPAWEMLGIDPQIKTLVNREDLAALCASIRAARELADIVVVSCHWGILEDRVAIGEYQREAAHEFIDNGADLILGHGPLVTKGIEVYAGKAIFYCLGKFIMVPPQRMGDVPIGVSVPFGKESRKGTAAVVTIDGGQISRVAFRPSFSDDLCRPAFLEPGDEMFAEIVNDLQTITQAADLPATLTLEGNEVVVSAAARPLQSSTIDAP